ncbi:hypothetical protein ER308_07190 [Egibacter rhizosphaerae]|uniref:Uncharacterized protein n=1 Tax=Egibacter rhizosphaerae TaxID=1670831 RepID=A0A411YDU8_9ACTN|nr:DUF5309 family protein [Egibacter rhizosphaerae]QBI19350.1 hypothetical protein ER308_07190 [Egibacter rhizosphaerae]
MPDERPLTEYQFTAGQPRDFEPLIALLDPSDVVLQGQYGADGRTILSSRPASQKKVEWQDETLLLPRATLSDAMTDAQETMDLGSNDERQRFQTGDVVMIDDEKLRVTGYNDSDGVLDVARGVMSTTASTHDAGDDVTGLGAMLPEGSDPQENRALDRTDRHNFTQIFGPTLVKVSGTKMVTQRWGVASEYNHQAERRTREQFVAREQALIYGTRFNDESAERRAMGGLTFYITENVDSSTSDLDYSSIRDQLQTIYEKGGSADRLLCSIAQKAVIDDFDNNQIRLQRVDNGRGEMVDVLFTSYGDVTVVKSREVKDKDVFLYNRDQAIQRPLRPMQFVPRSTVGDYTSGFLVSERSLEFRRDRHAARFNSLTV